MLYVNFWSSGCTSCSPNPVCPIAMIGPESYQCNKKCIPHSSMQILSLDVYAGWWQQCLLALGVLLTWCERFCTVKQSKRVYCCWVVGFWHRGTLHTRDSFGLLNAYDHEWIERSYTLSHPGGQPCWRRQYPSSEHIRISRKTMRINLHFREIASQPSHCNSIQKRTRISS